MAESTLSLTRDDLDKEIAYYLGWGYTAYSSLTSDQKTVVDAVRKSGLRQFYFPPPIKEGELSHEWSFLRPVTTITVWATATGTVVGQGSYASPVTTIDATADVFHASMVGKTFRFDTLSGTISGTPSYDSSTGETTVVATASIFTEEVVGATLTAGTTYTIASYVSATTITVTGDASGESGAFTVTGDDSYGTEYTIAGYASATQITVTGDASSEVSDDTFTITADGAYSLPDNFGALHGPLTFVARTSYPPLEVVGEAEIRRRQQESDSTTRPSYAAVRVRNTPTTGQRQELLVSPTPNQDYELEYRYTILMDALSTGEYPLGGMQHAETIKASCLAAAEYRENDQHGPKWQEFLVRLAASVDQDNLASTPEYFVRRSSRRVSNLTDGVYMRYNGIDYR